MVSLCKLMEKSEEVTNIFLLFSSFFSFLPPFLILSPIPFLPSSLSLPFSLSPPLFSLQGVLFQSPHDQSEMLMTPEHSMFIQNKIGADIMMAMDDVVSSKITGLYIHIYI